MIKLRFSGEAEWHGQLDQMGGGKVGNKVRDTRTNTKQQQKLQKISSRCDRVQLSFTVIAKDLLGRSPHEANIYHY